MAISRTNFRSFTVNLSVLLILCFVTLMVLVTSLTLTIGYDALTDSTREQLRQKSEIITLAIAERIKAYLDPIPAVAGQLDRLLALQGAIDDEQILPLLSATLEALPQAATIALVTPELRVIRSFRKQRPGIRSVVDWSDDPAFRSMVTAARALGRPGWGPLFFSEASHETYLNFLHPVPRTKQTLIVNVSVGSLSRFLERIEHEVTGRTFILRDRNFVLAHTELTDGYPGLSDKQPLPSLSTFSDPVLRDIWSENHQPDQEKVFLNDLQARVLESGGRTYVFLYRELVGYGAKTWQVGSYSALDEIAPQFVRNRNVVIACLVLVAVAVLIALLLSHQIGKPFKELAHAARRIANWQHAPELGLTSSRITEISETTSAFRAMISALRSFERYVPRALVGRLVSGEQEQSAGVEERPVTIMFTDIIGFTGLAETMQAAEVASLLNSHFELVDGCIEAYDGTVDKYIGDAVMAFWGGVHADSEQAIHACRAALKIETAIHEDNMRRTATGQHPIRVRIGIHTGLAVIGNIGSPARINYTVIGDSVNMAARLERLARRVDDPGKGVVTVISGETAARLGPQFKITRIGREILEGRHEETEIFILDSYAASDPDGPSNNPPST